MPPEKHAFLGASSSERWINCPPSQMLSRDFPDTVSPYAKEGTCAHELCEYKIKKILELPCVDPTDNLDFYDQEMEECADDYASYILELKSAMENPKILIEQRVDFSKWVPDGFGTADCVLISDDEISIVDFKYGAGIEVSAYRNTQMMCYALGVLDLAPEVSTIRMCIFQPRKENVSESIIDVHLLLHWAENTLKPAADQAYIGTGEFRCGKWCTFCKAKSVCRARAQQNMEIAKFEFKEPATLSDEEITEILKMLPEITSWAKDVQEYTLQQALDGKHWEGFKLVNGRSVRKYTDENAVAKAVIKAGKDPYKHEVLGITAMSKLLGKRQFEEILGDLVYKPAGKPVLVPEGDKREEIKGE